MYHFAYVLMSNSDKMFYIGYTRDIKTRVKKHNSGEVPSTKRRKPFRLIYFEAFIDKGDALRRERYFKSNDGKRTLKIMLRNTLLNNQQTYTTSIFQKKEGSSQAFPSQSLD